MKCDDCAKRLPRRLDIGFYHDGGRIIDAGDGPLEITIKGKWIDVTLKDVRTLQIYDEEGKTK